MNRVLRITLWAVCAAAAVPPLSADELTLQDALQKVLTGHPAVIQADAAVTAASARVWQKRSAYFPTIEAVGGYAHLDPDPIIPFPGMGNMQFFPADNIDYHLGLKYDLFDFGRTGSAVDEMKCGLSRARHNAEGVRHSLALATLEQFYGLLLSQQSVQVQEQELQALIEHRDLTQKKVDAGTATQFDLLTIQVKCEEARSRKIDGENALSKARIAFRKLVGVSTGTAIVPVGEFSAVQDTFDESALIAAASAARPELLMARDTADAAARSRAGAAADHYPSIGLSFSWGAKNGYFPDLTERLSNTVAAAQVTLPLFSGLRTWEKAKEADAQYAAARSNAEDAAASVAAEIREAVSDFNAAVEKVKAAEFHVQLASEAVSQARVRYANGVITNLDMINAETSLSEARLMKLQALYSHIVSRARVYRAAGRSPASL